MANKGARGRCAVYLVDLARVHVICGETGAALRYFENAKRVLSSQSVTNHRDTAYLYEQWALVLVTLLENRIQLEVLEELVFDDIEHSQNELRNKLEEVCKNLFQCIMNGMANIAKKLPDRYNVLHLMELLDDLVKWWLPELLILISLADTEDPKQKAYRAKYVGIQNKRMEAQCNIRSLIEAMYR